MRELRKRMVCCIIAVVILFSGMNVEKTMEQSSSFRVSKFKSTEVNLSEWEVVQSTINSFIPLCVPLEVLSWKNSVTPTKTNWINASPIEVGVLSNKMKDRYLSSSCYIVEDKIVCPPIMLLRNHMLILRMNKILSTLRWNRIFPLNSVPSKFGQYLFLYQKAESKEDAQLFLSRSVIVNYIHCKDSGE